MRRPICVDCEVQFAVEEVGIFVVEMFDDPPRPYKVWAADLWRCPGCKKEAVAGFGEHPLWQNFDGSDVKFSPAWLEESKQRIVRVYERVKKESIA